MNKSNSFSNDSDKGNVKSSNVFDNAINEKIKLIFSTFI